MKRSLRKTCLQRLHDTFGLTDFRPGQFEAVQALLSGRDVMCILPTGAGKSLCWQLPAVVHDGLTVVVSPLIALMRDQVQHLNERGIPAVSLDSTMTAEERTHAMQSLRNGSVRIVFVSPERLMQDGFCRLCREMQPWMIVVDEAHCIVHWGESFRPAYGVIGGFIAELQTRPVLCALTATADRAVRRAIRDALGLKGEKLVHLPLIRGNLNYDVRTTLDAAGDILRLMRRDPCKTVIFCRTRFRAEQMSALLAGHGFRAAYYHAGLTRDDRMLCQNRFTDGDTQVLCATTAFGMGVDVQGIQRIIHEDVPDNVIDYAQHTGRAGRDGRPAECILFIEPQRLVRRRNFGRNDKPSIRRYLQNMKKRSEFRQLLRIVLSASCIPAGITAAFGQKSEKCGRCSACRHGALLQRVPDLTRMKEWQVRAFFLQWQRDALARQRGCTPKRILPDAALHMAAKKLVFPQDVTAPMEMERLLMHFRHERMHDSN